jgi:hypothetical protein
MDVAESAAILGNSQTVADWRKPFATRSPAAGYSGCSGLPHSHDGLHGNGCDYDCDCSHVGFELEEGAARRRYG